MKLRALSVAALFAAFIASEARAQQACNPACAPNEVCSPDARCVSACNPACAANEVCSPDRQCVSACNPTCADNEVCTPDAQCVSACNPACAAGQRCENQTCVAVAPAAPPPAPPPAPSPVETAEPATATGVYLHDGFYFNIGLGLGSLSGTAEPSEGVLAGGEISAWGLAILTQLAFGATVAPGLVVGGGIYGATIPSPTLLAELDQGNKVEDDTEASSLSQIGPFVAYYFSPEIGAHLFAAPALSVVSGGKAKTYPDEVPETSGTGFGLVLGGGYEIWVAEQWSLGVIGRLQYASATLEDDDGSETDFSGTIVGVLVGATLH